MVDFHNSLGRIGGLAVADIVATIGVSALIAKKFKFSYRKTILGGFVVGEVTHLLLKIKTPINS